MIRPIAALTRQAQDFFHTYLVGIFPWDEVQFAPAEKNEKPQPEINARGRRRRPERAEGKYHAKLVLEFGIWRLTIKGPTEHPPLGWLVLEAHETLEGTLDPATWKRFGEHIRQTHKEISNVVV